MLWYGQLIFQYPSDTPINFPLTKAVAGELIWRAAQTRLRNDSSILCFWGAKCVLQENTPSDLRVAVLEKANRLQKERRQSTEGGYIRELADHVEFFMNDYEEASDAASREHFMDLLKFFPGEDVATLIAAIGYKFGLTSL